MPHFGDDGDFGGFISSFTDITGQKRVEQVLRDDQERFRLMLETAPVMIWQSDAAGRCRYLNRRLCEFWKLSSADVASFGSQGTIHPVGVFIARDAACTQMTMNEAGARMLRIPPTANPSKTGPSAPTLPFRVFQNGRELDPTELIMQRASSLGRPIHGVEIDIVFSDGSTISLQEAASPLFDEAGRVRGCVAVFVDITERKRSARQKSLLIDELNHRVKNTLSIVQSIANQTLRLASDPETFTAAFTSRLAALARTHALLTQSSWEGSCLDSLLSSALSPFEIAGNRIVTGGPPVSVRSSIAVTLSLVLHELATNAVKHGALSTDDGRLAVTWSLDGGLVQLQWEETNGPRVGAVKRRGFGSRLIAASADKLGGSIDLDYAPSGFTARLVLTP